LWQTPFERADSRESRGNRWPTPYREEGTLHAFDGNRVKEILDICVQDLPLRKVKFRIRHDRSTGHKALDTRSEMRMSGEGLRHVFLHERERLARFIHDSRFALAARVPLPESQLLVQAALSCRVGEFDEALDRASDVNGEACVVLNVRKG
jgi:hypothetical protein